MSLKLKIISDEINGNIEERFNLFFSLNDVQIESLKVTSTFNPGTGLLRKTIFIIYWDDEK